MSVRSRRQLVQRSPSQVSWVLGAWGGASSLPAVDLPGAQPDWSTPVPSSPYPGTGPVTDSAKLRSFLRLLILFSSRSLKCSFFPATFRQGAGQFRGIGSRVLLFASSLISSLYILSAFHASSLPLTTSSTHHIISTETARYC